MSSLLLAKLRAVFVDGSEGDDPPVTGPAVQPLQLPQYVSGHIDIEAFRSNGQPKDISATTLIFGARRKPTDADPALSLQFNWVDDPVDHPGKNLARAEVIAGHWINVPPRLYGYDVVTVISADERFPVVPDSDLKVTDENAHPGDSVQVPDSMQPLAQGPTGPQGPPGPAPASGPADTGRAIVSNGANGAQLGPVPATAAAATGSSGTGNTSTVTAGYHETIFATADAAYVSASSDGTPGIPSFHPGHATTLRVTFDPAWDGGPVTIIGVGPDGQVVSEEIPQNPGGESDGVKGFIQITSATAAGGGVGVFADVGPGPGIALVRVPFAAITRIKVNGVDSTVASASAANGTFFPTVTKSTQRFDVYYTASHVHTGPAHTHVQT